MCAHIYAYTSGEQKLTSSVFFSCFPLYFGNHWPGSSLIAESVWLVSPGDPPVSTLQIRYYRWTLLCLAFSMASGNLNSYSHACSASTLPTYQAVSLPWDVQTFYRNKIPLCVEDKCLHVLYSRSSVTGHTSQWMSPLWLIP